MFKWLNVPQKSSYKFVSFFLTVSFGDKRGYLFDISILLCHLPLSPKSKITENQNTPTTA